MSHRARTKAEIRAILAREHRTGSTLVHHGACRVTCFYCRGGCGALMAISVVRISIYMCHLCVCFDVVGNPIQHSHWVLVYGSIMSTIGRTLHRVQRMSMQYVCIGVVRIPTRPTASTGNGPTTSSPGYLLQADIHS